MDATMQRMRVAEQAASWWVAMLDNPSRAEREAYVAWLRESPVHLAEMLHLHRLHADLEQFRGWARIHVAGGIDQS